MSRNWWACTILQYATLGAAVNLAFRDGLGVLVCSVVAAGAFLVYEDVKAVRRGTPL